jgi:hypothetical protein
MAEVLLFTICGFLLTYIWTRLILGERLTAAEREAEDGRKIDQASQGGGGAIDPAAEKVPR